MRKISPLASVDPAARIADDVEVGPFCVVGPDVVIGPGNKLMNNVTLVGHTTVGRGNVFFPNSVVGAPPQDKKYKGEPTRLEIGDDNHIREAVTLHVGTEKGGGITRLGSGNLLMVNVHVGHDCQIGDNCIIANNVMIAGHVVTGNNVVMNGLVGVNQFVTIGDYAYLVGAARIHHDVPPFVKVDGDDRVRGLNKIGLSRAGFSEPDIEALDQACRKLFLKETPLSVVMKEYDTNNGINPQVKKLVDFLKRRDEGKYGRYLESLRK